GRCEALNAAVHIYCSLWNPFRIDWENRRHDLESHGGFLINRILHRAAKVEWERMELELEPARFVAARHWRRLARGISAERKTNLVPDFNAMLAAIGIQTYLESRKLSAASVDLQDIRLITACALRAPYWKFPSWFLALMRERPD